MDFLKIPAALQEDAEVTPHMLAAYAAIVRFTDFNGNGGCFASQATLAEVAHMSVRQLNRALDALEAGKWIQRAPEHGRRTHYHLPKQPLPSEKRYASQAGVPLPHRHTT